MKAHFRTRDLLIYIALVFGLCGVVLVRGGGLFRGQVIKQFHAFSISETLGDPGFPFGTSLPCVNVRTGHLPQPWVEEPPIFHILAWSLREVGITAAEIAGLIAFLLLASAIFRLFKMRPKGNWTAWEVAAITLAPAFARYSFQHFPDLLATAFLAWAMIAILERRLALGAFILLLAVTTKGTTFFAAGGIWLFALLQRSSRVRPSTIIVWAMGWVLFMLPFALWLYWIHSAGLPSPFHFSSFSENRHSGSWSLIFTGAYWQRVLTWLFVKGSGLPLACLWIYGVLQRQRFTRWAVIWGGFVLPYWFLVRDGNSVHDYYSLPFVLPFAWMGVEALEQLPRRYRRPLLVLCVSLGFVTVFALRPIAPAPWTKLNRPFFCDAEKKSS